MKGCKCLIKTTTLKVIDLLDCPITTVNNLASELVENKSFFKPITI